MRTEERNPNSTYIDRVSTAEMVQIMQDANLEAARAVAGPAKEIAAAIEATAERMKKGGRLLYVGCGTSGRLGVLDASECPPTYGVPHELVVGVMAGGYEALYRAGESAEDDAEAGKRDLAAQKITALDTVMGISVAGNAAYVAGALDYANEVGALTLGLTCNPESKAAQKAAIAIVTDTGPEIITGSTRMKAGSAHKMVLNMLSTGVMIKLGRVYENHMIYVQPTNEKLKRRVLRITSDLMNCSAEDAEVLLDRHGWSIPEVLKNK